MVTAGA